MSNFRNWLERFFKSEKNLGEEELLKSQKNYETKKVSIYIHYFYNFLKNNREVSDIFEGEEKRVYFEVPKDFQIWLPNKKDKFDLENEIYNYVYEKLTEKHKVDKIKFNIKKLEWTFNYY